MTRKAQASKPQTPDVETIEQWLQSKGIGLWPSVSAMITDPRELRQAAQWFHKQMCELQEHIDRT